jgi:hypothetical protein
MLDITVGQILGFIAFWVIVALGWAAFRGFMDGRKRF